MANPYPPHMQPGMMPQQQPMGGPPMQMQQMQPPQPQRAAPVRRGTSRAVPVVVSAGLAVGVFCGLLFGLGTGEEVLAGPSKGNNVKVEGSNEPKIAVPNTVGSSTTVKPTTPTTPTGSGATTTAAAGAGSGSATTATTPAAGSAATTTTTTTTTTTAAGSGATAGSAAPAAKTFKLKVELTPEAVASTAKITVDQADVTGGVIDINLGTADKKDVKVVVKASGYKTIEQKVSIEGDVTVKFELVKRSSGSSTPSRPPSTGTGTKKPPNTGGGLIDI